MVFDSYDHLMEARAGRYTDSHPPAISLICTVVTALLVGVRRYRGATATSLPPP